MNPLLERAIAIAVSQVGVREIPPGSNRGPEVDGYLIAAGLDPTTGSYPYCAAFVYWVFRRAAEALAMANPCPRTASASRLLERAAWARVTEPTPGCVFVIDHGGGKGHAGIVERVADAKTLITIEGNTDPHGSRDGVGVYERTRLRAEIFGYLDFSRLAP